MSTSRKINIFGLSLQGMEELMARHGEKPYRGRQLFQWVYQKEVGDFAQMSSFNRTLRDQLSDHYNIELPEIVREQQDPEDGTRKFLVKLRDGAGVEMVLIPIRGRLTLCISSQVGCTIGCKFCATGLLGFKRNLSPSEIVGQFVLAKRLTGDLELNNVVMMGMGEPLLNLDSVLESIEIISSELGLGFSARRFTISTVGLIREIRQLTEYKLKAGLALSLHAPNQALRERLIPAANDNPLDELIEACRAYVLQAGDRVTLEYILIAGITDTMACAQQLARIANRLPCKINLIPYNPIIRPDGVPLAPIKEVKKGRVAAIRGTGARDPRRPAPFSPYDFRTPTQDAIDRFREYLYPRCPAVTLRTPKGRSIAAACGQLAGQLQAGEMSQ